MFKEVRKRKKKRKRKASNVQIAFAECLSSVLKCKVYGYDPMFSVNDTVALTNLGWEVANWTSNQERVFYFMPHCDRFLYNIVLESNWKRIGDLVLISNSFLKYSQQQEDDLVQQVTKLDHYKEVSLLAKMKNISPYILDTDLLELAFGDVCMITF